MEEGLEMYSEPHREPVERGQDRGDVVPFSGARQESRCGVLDQLQAGQGRLADASVKGVAVIEVGGDECVDDLFQVIKLEELFHFSYGLKLEEASFYHGIDLFVKFQC